MTAMAGVVYALVMMIVVVMSAVSRVSTNSTILQVQANVAVKTLAFRPLHQLGCLQSWRVWISRSHLT